VAGRDRAHDTRRSSKGSGSWGRGGVHDLIYLDRAGGVNDRAGRWRKGARSSRILRSGWSRENLAHVLAHVDGVGAAQTDRNGVATVDAGGVRDDAAMDFGEAVVVEVAQRFAVEGQSFRHLLQALLL